MDDANQKKKVILMAIVASVILFVIILSITIVFMSMDARKTKIMIGNNLYKTNTTEMRDQNGSTYQRKSIQTQEHGELPMILVTPFGDYYCIESISTLFGYRYNKGSYIELDENTDKCHISTSGEFVSFSSDSDNIHKYIKKAKYEKELAEKEVNKRNNGQQINTEIEEEEQITLENPVIKFVDGKLYASYDAITQGLNMNISVADNTVTMYSLEELVKTYSSFLSKKGYNLSSNYKNKRALYKGLAVVGQNDEKYGVVQVNGNDCKDVISLRYDYVEYVQSIEEFVVASDSNYGMLAPGAEKPTVPLEYDSIQLLDANNKLYIVEVNKKFGVVNASGKVIVPTEYDQIGLNNANAYSGQGLENNFLIAKECIPVKRNGLYGLFSKDGYIIARTIYNSIGCEDPAKLIQNTSAMPTVVVPLTDKLQGIVFSMKNNTGTENYGMMTTNGDIILNAYYTAIYYMTSNGQPTYYFNKVNNNELLTLQELINTRTELKNLIQNNTYKKKSQSEIDADTKAEQAQIDNTTSEDVSNDSNQTETDNQNGDIDANTTQTDNNVN